MKKNKENNYKEIEKELAGQWKKAKESKRQALLKIFDRRIVFLQHERLVHLLVTLFFSAISIILGILTPFSPNWPVLAIFLITIITTLFYVAHYYTLENTCQHWQKLYIKLKEELIKAKK